MKLWPHKLLKRSFAGVVALVLSGCQAAIFSAINVVTEKDGVAIQQDIVFDPSLDLKLDVYAPVAAKDAPVVVFFYGGAWQDGKRGWYRWAGKALAQQGVVAVVPDYRKFPRVKLDGFMHDAATAVAWAKNHAAEFGGNPNALFLMGHSAGAHIGAMLATDDQWLAKVGMRPSQLAGFIGLAGPYDFLPLKEQVYIDLFGTSAQEQARSQPVNYVNGDEPPMLLLQGESDTTVLPRNARSLAAEMNAYGEFAETRFYADVNHAWLLLSLSEPFRERAPAMADALQFIDVHDQEGRRQPIVE